MKRFLARTLAVLVLVAVAAIAGLVIWIRVTAAWKDVPDTDVRPLAWTAIVPPHPTSGRILTVAQVGDRHEIVDAMGRVVVLRGINLGQAAREAPWQPIALGDEATFERLRSWGVNAIRLAVPWEALEPIPRQPDLDQLDYLKWFAEVAQRNGMVVIVNHYQDEVSRCFGGVGAPPWAHRPGVVPKDVLTNECREVKPGVFSLPRQLRWWADFWDNAWTPDDMTLQDHAISSFVRAASMLRANPAVLGFVPLDEPHCYEGRLGEVLYPGDRDCEDAASDFYARFATAIRAVNVDALAFFEPPMNMLADAWDGRETRIQAPPIGGGVLAVDGPGRPGPDAACSDTFRRDDCRLASFLRNTGALAESAFGAPRVLTKFGAGLCEARSGNDLKHQLVDVEDAMASAFAGDLAAAVDAAGRPRCAIGAFVRPYPQRIAGIPIAWGWDQSFTAASGAPADTHHDGRAIGNTGMFTLKFRQGAATGETFVWIPRARVFGDDPVQPVTSLNVRITDGSWRWSNWDPNLLIWQTDPAIPEHALYVGPKNGRATGNGVGDCQP